ncbi:iron complex outermembrane recepter protein/hemoglobin/transferrin/lactoferrin receptor protein [Fodinibius roseus]|uniref:Iron complex outermembrane recepter protein/hemoglobin/transferrin/lactoferrin receptor protein n=1 Tax=Fodinibius roseus TaxID=1194090 RepID=A0A1M4TCI7_9BACT|nr:TonB-dependent receptor [Fodinibius roseus]SHE42186.1 iron complex outermembrane recepter protein/hemoglobin/transferrin/lactoferrin receptor protein [Fodinibius roseus]
MKNLYRPILLLALITIGLIGLTVPPVLAQTASVEGTVRDPAGKPLAGVNVALPDLRKGTSTNADGTYRITDLPAGSHAITYSFVGYNTHTLQLSLDDGEVQTLDVTLTRETLQTETVTVTGTPYESDPLTTPADVDVLTGDTKFSRQQTSLGASLDELAGVSTISTGSQTGKPVIRGLSGSRVRVLDDGTAMDYQQYGVRHGPNVDPFTSERIEVVRGAASVQYGSDALGGAVNVISNALPDATDEAPFLQGETLGEFSSNNDELVGGVHLNGAVNRWGFTGTIIRRTAGNMTAPDVPTFRESDDTSAPKFSGELDHTDYDQLNGSLGIGYQTGIGQLSAEYTRWQNEHNFLLPNGRGLGQNLENNTLQIEGDLDLGHDFTLSPQLTYSTNLRQSNPGGDQAEPRSGLPDDGYAHLDVLLDSYTARTELKHPGLGSFSGMLGLEYKYQDQETRGAEPLVPSAKIHNIAAFVFEQAELDNLTLSFGARFDARNQQAQPHPDLNLPDYNAGETDEVLDQSFFEFSGSLGATYQFTKQLAIAANIGRGFRAPSLFNLHADGVHGGIAAYQRGNPYLDSEYSLSTDFSLRWRSNKVQARATVYRNAIDNYMFLVNTGEFADPDNEGPPILEFVQGDARLVGGNADISARLLPWLQLSGTFETVKGENVEDDISEIDDLPLLPPTRLSGKVSIIRSSLGQAENLFLSLGVQYTSSKEAAGRYEPFWQFGNSPEFSDFGVASTDAYTLFNATLGSDIPLWNRPVSLQLSANNLLNTAYRDFLDTYKGYALSPGRDIRLRIKIPFPVL